MGIKDPLPFGGVVGQGFVIKEIGIAPILVVFGKQKLGGGGYQHPHTFFCIVFGKLNHACRLASASSQGQTVRGGREVELELIQ
jgi:hypothetical protein